MQILLIIHLLGGALMSLKETYEELTHKETSIQKELTLLQTQMKLLEDNITGIETNPHFLETDVAPFYESLWQLQMEYKKNQTKLNMINLQLNQLSHILKDLIETKQTM